MENKVLTNIIVVLLVLFVVPIFFQLAWNNILVDLCSFKVITYWQSFWVCFIGRMSFAGHRSIKDEKI